MRQRAKKNTPGVKCPNCHKSQTIKDGWRFDNAGNPTAQRWRCMSFQKVPVSKQLSSKRKDLDANKVFYDGKRPYKKQYCSYKFVERQIPRHDESKDTAIKLFGKMIKNGKVRTAQAKKQSTVLIEDIAKRCQRDKRTIYRYLRNVRKNYPEHYAVVCHPGNSDKKFFEVKISNNKRLKLKRLDPASEFDKYDLKTALDIVCLKIQENSLGNPPLASLSRPIRGSIELPIELINEHNLYVSALNAHISKFISLAYTSPLIHSIVKEIEKDYALQMKQMGVLQRIERHKMETLSHKLWGKTNQRCEKFENYYDLLIATSIREAKK